MGGTVPCHVVAFAVVGSAAEETQIRLPSDKGDTRGWYLHF